MVTGLKQSISEGQHIYFEAKSYQDTHSNVALNCYQIWLYPLHYPHLPTPLSFIMHAHALSCTTLDYTTLMGEHIGDLRELQFKIR